MTATLIVSVSGIVESSLVRCAEFATELDARLVPASWLLPPRPRDGRHLPHAPAIEFLRERTRTAEVPRDALVLHGFDHAVPPLARPRIGRRAEFAGLPSHEASLRLIAAVHTMDHLGLRSDVFAPPRWLCSAGTLVALRRRGFRVCADSTGVRLLDRPGEGRLLRARVLGTGMLGGSGLGGAALGGAGMFGGAALGGAGMFGGAALGGAGKFGASAGPDAGENWRARSLVAAAARIARRGGLVRIAADAAELARPSVRRAVLDAVDAALAAGALPVTYRAPLPTPEPLTA